MFAENSYCLGEIVEKADGKLTWNINIVIVVAEKRGKPHGKSFIVFPDSVHVNGLEDVHCEVGRHPFIGWVGGRRRGKGGGELG